MRPLETPVEGVEQELHHTYYSYLSSCQVQPKVSGKKNFINLNMSQDQSSQNGIMESIEAKTIFAMQKFELVTDP